MVRKEHKTKHLPEVILLYVFSILISKFVIKIARGFIHQRATDVIFKFCSFKSTYSGKVPLYEIHNLAKGTKKTINIKNELFDQKIITKVTYLKTS